MNVPGPFHVDGEHLAIGLPGARAVFTTRRGGASRGRYASLNLGRWTDDDPSAVVQNRELLARRFGVRLASGRQVHGARVARAAPPATAMAAEADGLVTAQCGLAPMVLTADCLPIAIAGGGAVAMLHAGWRGLSAGIVAEGVRAMTELGAEAPLAAAIGPGAGPCCYEVSESVHDAFAIHGPAARRGRNLDLKTIACAQLEAAGVAEIHDCGVCTICSDPTLFYSHRREEGMTGRQAGIAWLS